MKKEEFIVFEKSNDQGTVLALANLLEQNNIKYILEDSTINMPFVNTDLAKIFIIKLKKDDFAKVESLQKEIALAEIEAVNKNHYLFDFSEEELIEIIKKPDEWNAFDILLAKKILKDRGIEISPETSESFKKERQEELEKPEKEALVWIYLGYIFASMGGALGILIGWTLWKLKKVLPNGDKVYTYTESDRKHGRRMFIIGIISLFFSGLIIFTIKCILSSLI